MDESQGKNLNLVGLDEDNSILLEDSDAESFSFNEEDNEYYSDYDSEEDNSEEDNDEIDEEENKDNEDMQTDDDHSKKIIEGLRLLHLKSLYNFTETAYDNIMKIFTTDNLSLYKVKKYLKNVTELEPTCVIILVYATLEIMNPAKIAQCAIPLDWMEKERQKRLCYIFQ